MCATACFDIGYKLSDVCDDDCRSRSCRSRSVYVYNGCLAWYDVLLNQRTVKPTLNPLKWIIYAAELQDIVSRHGILFHGFADDSQLSKSMFVSIIQTGKRAMLDCIADVEAWCRYRGLKLNADKSEVLWLGTRQQLPS